MKFQKILFVITNMQQGGAERVVSVMSNYWAEKNNDISIMIFDDKDPAYKLCASIKIYKLNSAKRSIGIFNFVINNIIRTVNYFRCLGIIKPDIIISFADNANVYCILYNYFLRRSLIITQRTNPYYHTLPKIISWLPKLIYKSASAMVVQTAQTIQLYEKLNIKLPPIVSVIYNPININLFTPANTRHRLNIVLAVGRLNNKDKHFDKLIDMFTACNNSNWQLHIVGEGPDLELLQDKIVKLDLSSRVYLLGSIKDLNPVYQGAKIFAMTSQYEGFPNALCEAMANGCACISFNCPTGPSEIIVNGENGILIELGRETEYVKELTDLMNNEEKIRQFSNEAYKIQTMLDENKIMQQWDMLIDKILLPNNK